MEKDSPDQRAFILGNLSAALADSGCSGAAVYSWVHGGLALFEAYGEGSEWSLPPRMLKMVPALRGLGPRETYTIPDTAEAPLAPYAGCELLALRFQGELHGALLVDRVVDFSRVSIVAQLIAAHLNTRNLEKELAEYKCGHRVFSGRAETLAATGMLSAGVAHELNNPLNVVLGLSRMLQADMECSEAVREDASVIVAEASRAVRIVQQLLSYGRGGGVGVEDVDVVELAESVVSAFERTTLEGEYLVERTFDSGLSHATADPFRLQNAIRALLDNAYQAVRRLGAVAPRVHVAVIDSGAYVSVVVTDNGEGIAPDVLPRVYDPFFTTRETGSGTGMGLALVHKIMHDLGGDVSCENLSSGGARVTLHVPKAKG